MDRQFRRVRTLINEGEFAKALTAIEELRVMGANTRTLDKHLDRALMKADAHARAYQYA